MKLNLGCGNKKLEGWVNADMDILCNPDVVLDLTKPLPFEDCSVDEVLLDNVLEHLPIKINVLAEELRRIIKENGTLTIITPNCFYWKHRIKYLFGKFEAGEGYYFEHCWLLKPSFLREVFGLAGFVCDPISDLFDRDIRLKAIRRV